MIIEGFLTKIAAAVLKKAALGSFIPAGLKALEIYSAFEIAQDLAECVTSTNDCQELGLYGIKVLSDPLGQQFANQLFNLGNETFRLENSDSGLYIASKIAGTFRVSNTYGDLKRFFRYGSTDHRFFDYGKF